MPGTLVRGSPDATTQAIAAQLSRYTADHSAAEVEVFRYNPASIWVRVVDPDFRGMSRSDRHRAVWPILYELSEEVLGELSLLVLVAPEEKATRPSSREFDDPPRVDY